MRRTYKEYVPESVTKRLFCWCSWMDEQVNDPKIFPEDQGIVSVPVVRLCVVRVCGWWRCVVGVRAIHSNLIIKFFRLSVPTPSHGSVMVDFVWIKTHEFILKQYLYVLS